MSLLLSIYFSLWAKNTDKPNILIIVADDLGWADVGYHGSEIKTPHIDQLCKNGVELDQHYVAPMCTPTRVGLLTGRYWSRFGNTKPSNERVLPWGTMTLAGLLKNEGYETGLVGKWHLGSKPEWGGRKFGFDVTYGSLAGGVNPWSHLYKHGEYSKTWHRNDELIEEKGHVTDLLQNEAIQFVKKKRDTPFFLYLPFTAPHTPFDEPEAWLKSAEHVSEDRRQYVACVQHMDDAIGNIMEALRKTKQIENTLVIFFSDNGGTKGDDSKNYPNTLRTTKVNGLNVPLNGWKTNLFEGGVRVPAFVYWEGVLRPNKITQMLHCTDWLPTIANLLNLKIEKEWKLDGINIWESLTTKKQEMPREFYWHGVASKSFAYRQGDWKLITLNNKRKKNQLLFNIKKDPYEQQNLAQQYPEKVKALIEKLNRERMKDNDAVPEKDSI